ncbi:rhomboid-like protein [Streptomyces sp. NPDC059649]|uniref:rhomboid-like protein n=1 Tax=Streptomyces sp. NPDC059649 TaxID=3346895 RepID=UPI0036A80156
MTPRPPRPSRVPWAAALYVGAVQLGAYATARLPARRRTGLLRAHSTNVANLRAGRWGTLLTSAAFVEEPLPVPYGTALLAVLGTAERRWGTRRAAAVFAAGHIGASLLVYAGLRARTRLRGPATGPPPDREPPGQEPQDRPPPDPTAHAVDVGASYGFYATLGALAASVPHRGVRTAATAGLLALGIRPVLRRGRTFTDAGHLTALALGMATGTGIRAGRHPRKGGEPEIRDSRPVKRIGSESARDRRRIGEGPAADRPDRRRISDGSTTTDSGFRPPVR